MVKQRFSEATFSFSPAKLRIAADQDQELSAIILQGYYEYSQPLRSNEQSIPDQQTPMR